MEVCCDRSHSWHVARLPLVDDLTPVKCKWQALGAELRQPGPLKKVHQLNKRSLTLVWYRLIKTHFIFFKPQLAPSRHGNKITFCLYESCNFIFLSWNIVFQSFIWITHQCLTELLIATRWETLYSYVTDSNTDTSIEAKSIQRAYSIEYRMSQQRDDNMALHDSPFCSCLFTSKAMAYSLHNVYTYMSVCVSLEKY